MSVKKIRITSLSSTLHSPSKGFFLTKPPLLLQPFPYPRRAAKSKAKKKRQMEGGMGGGDRDDGSESRSEMDESLEAALEIEKEAVRKMSVGAEDKSSREGGGGLDAEAFRKKHEISVRVMIKGGKAVDPASEGVQVMDPVQVQ